MSWSTREIAEIAGTSLRTVRHYHDIGLLPVPERSANGYKQYDVAHLVRLLRIRRFVELGIPLARVAEVTDDPRAALLDLDRQLAATVEKLQRTRDELAVLLREETYAHDLPGDLASVVTREHLTDADRSFLLVVASIVSPEVLQAYVAMLRISDQDPALVQLTHLPEDADEATRADLAVRLRESQSRLHELFPPLRDLTAGSPIGRKTARDAMTSAIRQLYNEAQVDVLERIR